MIPYSISKEELLELPLGQFEGPIYLIDRPEQVEDAVDFLEDQPLIGFDTETSLRSEKGSSTTFPYFNYRLPIKPLFFDSIKLDFLLL